MRALRAQIRPEELLLGLYVLILVGCLLAMGARMPRFLGDPLNLIALGGLALLVFRRAWRMARASLPAAEAWPIARRQSLTVIRDFLPFVLTIALYEMLHDLTPLLCPSVVDAKLIALDRAIFGVDPSTWLGQFASPGMTAVMLACYLSYFAAGTLLACLTYWKGEKRLFREFMVSVCVMSALGFAGYLLVPAIGPYAFQAAQFTDRIPGGERLHFLVKIIDSLKGDARDCFPSLHTAHTSIVLVMAWRFSRRFFWLYLPVGVGLFFSTMYLRFHYGVDVLAGFATAGIALYVGPRLDAWWHQPVAERQVGQAQRLG